MNKIVVSLTTYKDRIDTINTVIESLNRQSVKPDVIALYLYAGEFDTKELNIVDQENLQVKFVDENLKGHKKYFYAFQDYADDIVITLDDDIYYHEDTVKKLLEYHRKYPNCVIANRTRFITIRDSQIENYYRWEKNFPEDTPSMLLMGTGVLGILYPPHIFDNQIFDIELIRKLALDNDDIWLKIHQIRSGVKTVLTDLDKSLNFIEGTQNTSLCHDNYVNNACNKTIADLAQYYCMDLRKIFLEEFTTESSEIIYSGLYSKCFKNRRFVIKKLNFNNDPESEYELNCLTQAQGICGRRGFGFAKNPSIIVYDYIDGAVLEKDFLSKATYDLICEYVGKMQQLPVEGINHWDKYKNDCIAVLEQYVENHTVEVEVLNLAECECVIHGDLNPNNILCRDGKIAIIDYENSYVGPSWWDKCYFLANYDPESIEAGVLSLLEREDIQRIILVTKIRIGRLIRKNMDAEKMQESLASWNRQLSCK